MPTNYCVVLQPLTDEDGLFNHCEKVYKCLQDDGNEWSYFSFSNRRETWNRRKEIKTNSCYQLSLIEALSKKVLEEGKNGNHKKKRGNSVIRLEEVGEEKKQQIETETDCEKVTETDNVWFTAVCGRRKKRRQIENVQNAVKVNISLQMGEKDAQDWCNTFSSITITIHIILINNIKTT